jgi:tetratricopeptide (TPR) repeat protein
MKPQYRARLLTVGMSSVLAVAYLSPRLASTALAAQGQSEVVIPGAEHGQETPPQTQVLSLEERADIFMARKAYADAIDYYQRALKRSNYASAPQWNKLGIAYQQQLSYRAARKAYEKSIRAKKDFPEPWNNIGTTYFLENKFRKCLRFYRHAIQLNPQAAAFHVNLGTAYYRLKKYPDSMEEYRTALNLDPSVLTERSSLGPVVETRSADPEYYFYVAKVFAALGRAEEAVRYLRRAFEDGFKDQKRIDEDPDLLKISQHPAYVELMKNPPVPIKE